MLFLWFGKKKKEKNIENSNTEVVEVEDDDTIETDKVNTRITRYHISKRKEDKKWQVRREGAQKPLKLFNTQLEAIAYAKQKALNQETSIVIHKEDGKIRKQDYSKK